MHAKGTCLLLWHKQQQLQKQDTISLKYEAEILLNTALESQTEISMPSPRTSSPIGNIPQRHRLMRRPSQHRNPTR